MPTLGKESLETPSGRKVMQHQTPNDLSTEETWKSSPCLYMDVLFSVSVQWSKSSHLLKVKRARRSESPESSSFHPDVPPPLLVRLWQIDLIDMKFVWLMLDMYIIQQTMQSRSNTEKGQGGNREPLEEDDILDWEKDLLYFWLRRRRKIH